MGKKKKKKCDDEIYYPEDILNEAYLFINSISGDVAIYKNIRKLNKLEPNKEADTFVAWWYMERYLNFPHALGMIYEYREEIEKFCETSNLMDVFIFLQKKMIFLYRLAKANGYIE